MGPEEFTGPGVAPEARSVIAPPLTFVPMEMVEECAAETAPVVAIRTAARAGITFGIASPENLEWRGPHASIKQLQEDWSSPFANFRQM
jgi:hypothetical protein